MKTIYLARHAKSSWNSGAVNDFERPLSNRGEADAARIGEELYRLNWKPEKIIASPAIRAKQTCVSLCDQLDFPIINVQWNTDIYAAYMVTLLHILTSLPETTNSIMLIGHNPAIEELLIHLCGDETLQNQTQNNGKLFTTGNVAKISVTVPWQQVVMSEAKLERLLRPKEL